MDSRNKKPIGSSSKPGRGRVSRAKPARGSSSQPFQTPRQTLHSTPQPNWNYDYRPLLPSPPQGNPDYPPINPNDYAFIETASFNAFDNYRDQPESFYSEDDLPSFPETQMDLGDDDDDHVEEVPPQSVTKKKFPSRAEKRAWSWDEEEALTMTWVQISTCPRFGNEQGKDGFWKRILTHFAKNIEGTTQSHHALGTKWREMNALISVFNGFYHQATRLWESGCNDLDIYKNAMVSFEKKHRKPFTHQRAREVVRQQAKWLEQKCVQDEKSSHFDKRRKSTESGHYESASNEPFDTVLPNLNDNPSPALDTRQRKEKKVASEASLKSSVADMVQEYTTKKTSLLEENAWKKKQLLDKYLQERDQRLENLKDKAMYRDHKFYNSPHDHITDPRMLKWTLDRKREVAAKHNWPWLWGD